VSLIRSADDAVAGLTDEQIALVVENYLTSDRLLAEATYPPYDGTVFFADATVPERGFTGAASAGWGSVARIDRHEVPVRHSEMLGPATLAVLGPLLARAL
jgi:thioesterase domain-containing protein